jgi:4-amino-4-deoxy-L-arabinose transferase-like glycosyltransferase
MWCSSWRHSIFFIVTVAFLLRLAVITMGHTYHFAPRRDHIQFGWEIGRLARSIANGQGFSSPTDLPSGPSAWAPPIYPYILAAVFKLFGVYSPASAWVILAFNSIFSALTCLTLYHIAERMYGMTVALATAWTWSFFPSAIFWPVHVVWEMSFSAFLLSLALLMTMRMGGAAAPRFRTWILFGMLWGLIALTNTALLSLFPLFLIWVAYRRRSHWLGGAVLCTLTVAVVITPWLVRNYSVFGKFVFIRDNLPLEMEVANNDVPLSGGLWTRNEHPGSDPHAMREFQQLGEIRFLEKKQQQVWHFITQRPGRFVRFTLRRAIFFWIGEPEVDIVAGYDLTLARHIGFFLPAVFSFAGLWLTVKNRKSGSFLLASCLLIYPIPYYVVHPFSRYKHIIEPEMILLAVYLFWAASKVNIGQSQS